MNNPPAFPTNIHNYGDGKYGSQGMTLRDYFAARAMSYWLCIPIDQEKLEKVSVEAYKVADAMLKAREE